VDQRSGSSCGRPGASCWSACRPQPGAEPGGVRMAPNQAPSHAQPLLPGPHIPAGCRSTPVRPFPAEACAPARSHLFVPLIHHYLCIIRRWRQSRCARRLTPLGGGQRAAAAWRGRQGAPDSGRCEQGEFDSPHEERSWVVDGQSKLLNRELAELRDSSATPGKRLGVALEAAAAERDLRSLMRMFLGREDPWAKR
jgi:hypothetical protein